MKKVVVTGGAGFIGSHLVDRLLQDKHLVVAVDDLSRGKWDNLPSSRKSLMLCECDVNNQFPMLKADIVYHLAADSIIEKSNLT